MGILNKMFKWFTTKDRNGNEMNLGYVLDGEPKTVAEVEKLFKAFQLEKYFVSIKPLLRQKIDVSLTPAKEEEFKKASSKIGGQPNLPNGQVWPKSENGKSMSFIGQLNFSEVSKYDDSGLLPKNGLALFFYCSDQEAWGFDPKDRSRFKVVYTPDSNETNKSNFPEDLEVHSIFKPNKIEFISCLSIPTWQEDSINGMIEDKDSDNYFEVSSGSENQIFGYANCVQGTMELECQLVTNGLYCGDASGYENPKRKELEAGANDWILLLQIDSGEEKTGMMWGDCGKIYFWIKKEDLLKKDFDKTWCILQCH
jgi:uncharacterized protein YwqG